MYKTGVNLIIGIFLFSTLSTFAQVAGQKYQSLPAKYLKPSKPLRNISDVVQNKPWIVYSDRANNESYNSAESTSTKHKNIGFLEEFYVMEETPTRVRVVKDNNPKISENQFSNQAIDFGWIPKDHLLLSQHCLVTYEGQVDKKIMLLNTVESVKEGKKEKHDYVPFYLDPKLKSETKENSTIFEVFFVYKQTEDAYLIGRRNRIDAKKKSIEVIQGWVPKNRAVVWNHRIAVEPNWDQTAVQERIGKNLHPSVFNDKQAAQNYVNTGDVKKNDIFWANDDKSMLKEGRLLGEWRRFPLFNKRSSNQIFNVGYMGNIITDNTTLNQVTKAEIDKKISLSRDAKRNINIIFVIDGTQSMNPYFSAMSNAIRQSMQQMKDNLGSLKTLNSLNFGAVVYRDFAEGDLITEVYKPTPRYNEVANFLSLIDTEHGKDKDLPEAVYYGIKKAIRLLKKGETNLLVLIGDAGNHNRNDNSQVKAETLIKLLSDYECNMLVYQVHNQTNYTTYDEFLNQMKNLGLYSSKAAAGFIEANDPNGDFDRVKTSSIKFENAQGKNKDVLSPHASPIQFVLVYPDKGSSLPASKLQDEIPGIVKHIDNYTNDYIGFIDKITSQGKSIDIVTSDEVAINTKQKASDFAPAVFLFLAKLGLSADQLSAIASKKFQMYLTGYAPTKSDQLQNEMFRKVLLLSRLELSNIINNIESLQNSYGENRRERMRDTWITILEESIGKINREEMMEKTMEDITKMLYDVPTNSSFLSKLRLKDITDRSVLPDGQFEIYITELEGKKNRLERIFNEEKNKFSFRSNDETYYWVPDTDMP